MLSSPQLCSAFITRAAVFPRQIFAKFHGAVCEIPLLHYYPQIPYILRPVGVVVLTDNTSKYEEFIVTCNTKHITLGH